VAGLVVLGTFASLTSRAAAASFDVYYRSGSASPWVYYSSNPTLAAAQAAVADLQSLGYQAQIRNPPPPGSFSTLEYTGPSYYSNYYHYYNPGYWNHWGGWGWGSHAWHHYDHHHDHGAVHDHHDHPHPTHHVHHQAHHNANHHAHHHAHNHAHH